MILKFGKNLNTKNEYTFISFAMNDSLSGVSIDKFDDNNIYEDNYNYFYYIKDIVDVGNCDKFKVKVKKGDIVSITATDNSYMVFPSKKSFAYAFNLEYNKVLDYIYKEVLLDGKPYVVKYIKDKEDKQIDGVVYTLAQLASYVSTLIKSYNYREAKKLQDAENENGNSEKQIIPRIIHKHYTAKKVETDKKYELNAKKIYVDENNMFRNLTVVNVSKSNRYMYDYTLIRMFAYMILTKSKIDREKNQEAIYCFENAPDFDTIEDVYKYLEDNQDIVNNFFIETEMLFNKPNEMYSAYAPYIDGIYMYYEYNGVKTYLYRSKDEQFFNNKSLKCTYVNKRFRHKIKGMGNIFNSINKYTNSEA